MLFRSNRSSALNQLDIVEITHPTFEQQSLLYHCREVIKESILNEKNTGNEQTNITSAMAYDSHWNTFKEKIIDVGILHHQFWNLLADESTDLSQLRDIGFKIQNIINELNIHWERMQEIYPDEPNALRRYGFFTDAVLNDKEDAHALFDKMCQSNFKKANYNKKCIQASNSCNVQGISPEGDPCIFISGQESSLGQITHCNIAFSKIFGYTKNFLLEINISSLMPEIYAEHHQEMLSNNLHIQQVEKSSKSELRVLGKFHNGYIYPLWLNILSQPTLLNKSNYVGSPK